MRKLDAALGTAVFFVLAPGVAAGLIPWWITGWRPVLLAYALLFALFVRGYEEPTLRRTFGADYAGFCTAVPRWLPRLRPWTRP